MLILTIRTDKPEAEIGLFEATSQLDYITWQAHRELSTTLHHKIDELLSRNEKKLPDIQGIICFKGPGSFTGLRIGLSVGNALAYGLSVPVVASDGEKWIKAGLVGVLHGGDDRVAVPRYGTEIFITQPKR